MAQERPRGATPHLRSGQQFRVPGYHSARAAERSYPTSEARGGSWEEPPHVQGAVAVRRRGAYSTFKVRRGSGEEIPLIQGKEQGLRFAGAAVKRYHMSKVRETQVRR